MRVKAGSHRFDLASTNRETDVTSASKKTSTELIDVESLLDTYTT